MEIKKSDAFSKNNLEFVTVAVEYCLYMEQCTEHKRDEFVDTVLKLLPLLYLKASILQDRYGENESYIKQVVSEEDYETIRSAVGRVMGEQDDYLDVFVEDMKYSDTPIRRNISEDLADIYQDLRNFVETYRQGVDETSEVALQEVAEHFRCYWGQTLVNTMRALHDVKYNQFTVE